MSQPATLSTPTLEIVGTSDTIDALADPPRIYAEDTYLVRPKPGTSIQPGLGGALQVLPGAAEGRLRFGNFVGLTAIDEQIVQVDSRRMVVPEAELMLSDLISSLQRLPSRALPSTGAAFDRLLGTGRDLDLLAYLVVRDAIRGHGRHDLSAAVARVLARPHESLVYDRTDQPIWTADRVDGATAVDLIARPTERIPVPDSSPLRYAPITVRLKGTLPARVRISRAVPTTDTLENRFVATVIDHCVAIVRAVAAHAAREDSASMEPLRVDAVQLATTLERWRRHRVLEDLRPLTRLPTTSTVLRKRSGYRHVLRFYADLLGRTRIIPPDSARQIVGLRDSAALYEWWCFFQVIEAVAHTHGAPVQIDPVSQSWQGAELGQGLTAHFVGDIRVEFNRRFSRGTADAYHSYSVPLRPDILVETPRERHIFDAKFAFESPGLAADDQDDQDDHETQSRARRHHIHKMHTYRDALANVASVQVLYPGSVPEWYAAPDSSRSLRGIGALPLRVGCEAHTQALRANLAARTTDHALQCAEPLAGATNRQHT
jgi:hypothetical protein